MGCSEPGAASPLPARALPSPAQAQGRRRRSPGSSSSREGWGAAGRRHGADRHPLARESLSTPAGRRTPSRDRPTGWRGTPPPGSVLPAALANTHPGVKAPVVRRLLQPHLPLRPSLPAPAGWNAALGSSGPARRRGSGGAAGTPMCPAASCPLGGGRESFSPPGPED